MGTFITSKPQLKKPIQQPNSGTIKEQNNLAVKPREDPEGSERIASIDEVIDQHRDKIAMDMSNLKVLALGINTELDEHNEILISLDEKILKAVKDTEKQTKDISEVLNKKQICIIM